MNLDNFMEDPSFPKTLLRKKFTHFFGLVRIEVLIEDRTPNLSTKENPYKFKHYIWIKIGFWKVYSWVYNSEYFMDEQPFID